MTLEKYDPNHEDLVEGCLAGRQREQRQLFDLYNKAMYNICLRMLKYEDDAREALQISFITVYRKLENFRFESTLGAWIKRIVINTCIDKQRKRKKEIYTDSFFESEKSCETQDEGIAGDNTDYTVQKIKSAMNELADGYRIVMTMYLFEGLDHAEIGEVLGVSESTSKSQYSRAKSKLREIISKQELIN